ncbi:MAG: CHAD domain-containing protein [Pseudomonadota bacterium]
MRLGRDEQPLLGLRRVMGDLVAHARAALVAFDPPERCVHAIRQDMKKLRGLLRLAAPGLERQVFRTANRAWRDVARGLAPCREAWVRTRTAAQVLEALEPDAENARLRQALDRFGSEYDREVEVLMSGSARAALVDRLDESGRRIARSTFAGAAVPILVAGHRTTYHQGRIGFRLARRVGETASFHDWRKQAKYLWYQTRSARCLGRRTRPAGRGAGRRTRLRRAGSTRRRAASARTGS